MKNIGYGLQVEQRSVLDDNERAVDQNLTTEHVLLDFNLARGINFGWCADWYVIILHKSLNLLQITGIAALFQLTFVHNHQNGNLPELFSIIYVEKIFITYLPTRTRKRIHLKKKKQTWGRLHVHIHPKS